jgi:hypothetical protein
MLSYYLGGISALVRLLAEPDREFLKKVLEYDLAEAATAAKQVG